MVSTKITKKLFSELRDAVAAFKSTLMDVDAFRQKHPYKRLRDSGVSRVDIVSLFSILTDVASCMNIDMDFNSTVDIHQQLTTSYTNDHKAPKKDATKCIAAIAKSNDTIVNAVAIAEVVNDTKGLKPSGWIETFVGNCPRVIYATESGHPLKSTCIWARKTPPSRSERRISLIESLVAQCRAEENKELWEGIYIPPMFHRRRGKSDWYNAAESKREAAKIPTWVKNSHHYNYINDHCHTNTDPNGGRSVYYLVCRSLESDIIDEYKVQGYAGLTTRGTTTRWQEHGEKACSALRLIHRHSARVSSKAEELLEPLKDIQLVDLMLALLFITEATKDSFLFVVHSSFKTDEKMNKFEKAAIDANELTKWHGLNVVCGTS